MEPGLIFVLVLVLGLGSLRLVRPLANALADVLRSQFERDRTLPGRDEEIQALHEVVESLQDQITRLTEKVEFTEKLLEKPREAPEPEVKTSAG